MKKALVIEDNEQNMELITFILEKNQFRTIRAETGTLGIQLAQVEKPDVILLDIQLPDMEGPEVLRKIRRTRTGKVVPIIAVTSYAMTGDRDRLLKAGCDGYVEKPIDPETIISTIASILRKHDREE